MRSDGVFLAFRLKRVAKIDKVASFPLVVLIRCFLQLKSLQEKNNIFILYDL